MATITDVSRLAGVSTATVSRVINRSDLVDKQTREIVLDCIAELNYRPNEMARGLANKSSRTIGIVINMFSSPYYGEMLDGAVRELRSVGFNTIVESSLESLEGAERAWDSLVRRQCDALIVHCGQLPDERLAVLVREHPKAVLLDRCLAGFEERSVYLDNRQGGRMAAEHLIDRGHRAIAMITGPVSFLEVQERSEGFLAAMQQQGLEVDPALIVVEDFTEEGGLRAMDSLLARQPEITAVFCQNDEMAVGVFEACRQHGLCIPDDLSVIGFDDLKVASYLSPKLTTIRQPLVAMGATSARLAHALAMGESENAANLVTLFQPELVERASVR